jgi:hypothetical protein
VPVAFNVGLFLSPLTGDTVCSAINECTEARSAIAARYNAQNSTIGVVWHRHRSGASDGNAVAYFNSFNTGTQKWQLPSTTCSSSCGVPVADSTAVRDEWAPALDYDTSGNYIVTYYDRRLDTNDRKYCVYASKLTNTGVNVPPDAVVTYTRCSDPMLYPISTLGEFHDVWNWSGKWYSAHVFIPDPLTGGSGQGDVYVSRIAP